MAASAPSPKASANRISDFMNASRMQRFISPAFSGSGTDTFSVRMGRVITDRVAHLDHEPVVGRVDTCVRFGMAVLESHERELRGRPPDVHGPSVHLAGDRSARVIDQEVGEALARLLAPNADPPDLRQAILEGRVPAVLLPRVGSTGPRALLQVLALQDPPVLVRTPRGHVPDGHVGAVGGMPVLVGSTALEEGLADLQGGGIVQVELVLEMAQERNVVVLGGVEIQWLPAIRGDGLVHAPRELGEPRKRCEPRGLRPGVLEPLFTDGVRHDDRGLDERKRVRVKQAVFPERAAELPQLQLEGRDAGAAGAYILRVKLLGREEDVARKG